MSNVINKGPCPHEGCGSSDAYATYDDTSTHCYSCGGHTNGNGERVEIEEAETVGSPLITGGHYVDLQMRGLTEETCQKWQYQIGEYNGTPCQIANYRDVNNKLVAQKIRMKDKQFAVTGDGKHMPLYGQWLWRDGGKSVTICEGEIDAMSMSQAWGHKWPVVSIPNGAGKQTAKSIVTNFEWLDKFETIVLMFDQDEAGEKAVAEIVDLLPVGKVKIARLPEKDANEVLKKHGPQALVQAFWDAKSYSPAGIVSGETMTVATLKQAMTKGYELPYPKMQAMTLGLRKGELTLLTAGSGTGKSTWARELAYDLHQKHGCKIGNIFLEENNAKTAQAYIAIHNDVPLGRLRANPTLLDDAAWQKGLQEVVHQRMWFYDHFGSLDSANLIKRIRYMATALKVDFVILDHISIVVSGQEESRGGERKDIDILMTRLRSMIEETGVGIIAIVHLNQPDGTAHEEGGRVTLRHLRGSGSLKQLSDNVYGMERDQQGDDPTVVQLRVLKCRELGETGEADTLNYNRDTGRLKLFNKPIAPASAEEEF